MRQGTSMSTPEAQSLARDISRGGRVALLAMAVVLVLGVLGWLVGFGPNAEPPYEFNEMVKAAKANPSDARIRESYSFMDQEYLWRLSLTPAQLEAVIAHQELAEARPFPAAFVNAFPLVWRPATTKEARFFSTPEFPFDSRGHDGDHWAAMYDAQQGFLYVWFKGNF